MARPLDDQGQALLDAASGLLSTEGPTALTVRRIAAEAGCSTMGVYSRFGGKDGVIEELYKQGVERLFEGMQPPSDGGDPLEDLWSCGRQYREKALANATHYMIVFGGAVPGFEPSAAALAQTIEAFGHLAARVRRAQDAGVLVDDEPAERIAEIIWATIHGHVMLELIGISATGDDPAERYDRTLQVLFDGFAPHGERATGPAPRARSHSGAGGI